MYTYVRTYMHRLFDGLPSVSSTLPLQCCIGYVHYLEQEVKRLKLASRSVGESADLTKETPVGAATQRGGWEGEGEGIVQQALLAAMKTDEGTHGKCVGCVGDRGCGGVGDVVGEVWCG